ncbi:MAG: hypothetical protein WAM46_12765, partial [Flavobacterium sp.]
MPKYFIFLEVKKFKHDMDRLRNYNLISQRFVTGYDGIPFIKSNYKGDIKYNISVDVFSTDYTKAYFKNFDLSNLYAIYIVDEGDDSCYFNSNVISKHNFYSKDIVVMNSEFNFFMNIEYNNRSELSKPFFFKSDNYKELKIKEILNSSVSEKEIIMGSFRKNIVKIDALKFLLNTGISKAIKFYTNITEA